MKIRRLLTALALAAMLTLSAGRAMADSATADAAIDWSTLTFSSPITWTLQESYVETGLASGYDGQLATGFVSLFKPAFDANSEVLAGTMSGLDAAYANVGTNGYGYAHADLYGTFTPTNNMTLTVSFNYELFGETEGSNAFSDAYVFLLLGDKAFEDFLTLRGTDSGLINGIASVTASLLAGHTYDFSMGASAEASPVPLPGALWLLGSGLVALAGIRRKAIE